MLVTGVFIPDSLTMSSSSIHCAFSMEKAYCVQWNSSKDYVSHWSSGSCWPLHNHRYDRHNVSSTYIFSMLRTQSPRLTMTLNVMPQNTRGHIASMYSLAISAYLLSNRLRFPLMTFSPVPLSLALLFGSQRVCCIIWDINADIYLIHLQDILRIYFCIRKKSPLQVDKRNEENDLKSFQIQRANFSAWMIDSVSFSLAETTIYWM